MKTENPQAFPMDYGQHGYRMESGMELRDYFAAKAMQGVLAGDPNVNGRPWNIKDAEFLVSSFYKLADAMLKERLKQKP